MKLKSYIGYLTNNIDNLVNYQLFQQKGLPIGYSEMESAIDSLIANRVKKKKGRRFIKRWNSKTIFS